METKTYGTMAHDPVGDGGRPVWRVSADPHVMIRIKRIFPRVRAWRTGEVTLADTPEVARDLEWVIDRWPMRCDELARARLDRRATEHREAETAVLRILGGHQPLLPLREPARPARLYQQQAADIVLATGRLLLADDVGLGKSMAAALVLREPSALPALVVTLTHLPEQWVRELEKSLPWLRSHVVTSTRVYDPATRCAGVDPDVLILNYHKLSGWSDHLAGRIQTVIFDEVQELRRTESQKYVAAARVADGSRFRVGLSATPIFNYGGEIHSVLSVLAPDALGTRDEFSREWGLGTGDKLSVADPAALGTYLRDQGLLLRRTRKEVARELPEVLRVPQPVPTDEATLERLTGDAVDVARMVLSAQTPRLERFRAAGDLDWRLRHATGVAKAPYVAEFVRLLLASEDRVVLFGWHRAVYEVWAERLSGFNPVFFTGEESAVQKQRAADAFTAGDSRVLVMSLRAGAGLDGLQEAAHVCVFGELDWSPGVHDQCVGRLHRDGQVEPVVAYFLVSDGGADPVMAEVLNLKRMQAEPIRDPQGTLFEEAPDNRDRVQLLAAQVLRRAGEPLPDEPDPEQAVDAVG